MTYLIELICENDLEGVKKAIKNGADVNAKDDDGRTALIWAAYWNKLGIAKFLIKMGADISLQDNYGLTAIDYAKANQDSQKMIDLLTKK